MERHSTGLFLYRLDVSDETAKTIMHFDRDTYRMMSEYLRSVYKRVTDAKKLFQVSMIDIERAPLTDARYAPINAPEVRFF